MLEYFFNNSVITAPIQQNISYSFATTYYNVVPIEQDPLKTVELEIRRRAENPVYGFSRFLGRLLGTIHENEEDDDESEYEYEEELDADSNPVLSTEETVDLIRQLRKLIKNQEEAEMLAWDFEPIEKFFVKPKNGDNERVCKYQSKSMKPQAIQLVSTDMEESQIMLEATSDDSGYFNRKKYNEDYNQNFLAPLRDHYRFSTVNGINNIPAICRELRVANEQGPIKLAIFDFHGSPDEVLLSRRPTYQAISLNDFRPWKNEELSCLKDFLDKDVTIILNSCSTGFTHLRRTGNNDFYNMNIQMMFASYVPGCTVWAPDFDVFTKSIEVEYNPFKVTSKGFDIESKVRKNCDPRMMSKEVQEQCFILQREIVSWTTLKKAAPLHLLPKQTFQKISPANADFCKEKITYLYMKEYCQEAGITPSESESAQKHQELEATKPAFKISQYFHNNYDDDYVFEDEGNGPMNLDNINYRI